jgi:hypothetical protein
LLIETYTIRRGDTLEGIATELLGHKDRSLEICVMNRGSIGKDCEAFAVSVALNNRIGAVIKIIPRSVLSTTVSLPYMYYDDEVYEAFAKDGEWIWYEVEEDDGLGLSNIADKYYGDWQLWPEICVFNRDKLGTESRCQEEVILIGMKLKIPVLTPSASQTPIGTPLVPTVTTTPTQEPTSTPNF